MIVGPGDLKALFQPKRFFVSKFGTIKIRRKRSSSEL